MTDQLISPNTLIPDLLREAPNARAVLDRYGLRGCGGPLGPHETLEFFARAHDVPLDRLLAEIGEAIESDSQRTHLDSRDASRHSSKYALPLVQLDRVAHAVPQEALGDSIYRPFFRAGISVVLTLGASWGVLLLLRIALTGSFTAASLHEVNAHGHAQIFGWVGLFVMGFAYQAFPRFKHTSLKHPRLSYATLGLMLVGLICRAALEPIATTWTWLAVPAIIGSAIETIAVGTFVWIILATLLGASKRLEFYDAYILTALFWFFAQTVYEAIYFTATIHAVDRPHLLDLVATWQGPLRDMQIHGFAMMMILGVSQRLFHNFYGLPAPRTRRSLVLLAVLNLAIVGELVGFVLMRMAGHAWAALWYSSVVVLAVAVTLLITDWHIFSRTGESDRSLKFLRTAYIWLFTSLAMLVLLPVYQFVVLPRWAPGCDAVRIGFSHAYHGAVRHAITVGFISLMIMGVAGKVVPTLAGFNVRLLNKMWLPFVLVNAGCALRVSMQTLTDFTSAAFPIAGASGLLELTGLALWAIPLWRLMGSRARASAAVPSSFSAGQITGESVVGEVLDRYPWILKTFVAAGFDLLQNRLLRGTVARWTTITQACRRMNVDEAALLQSLNAQRTLHTSAAQRAIPEPQFSIPQTQKR
jgi:hypothetical protein